MSKLRIIRFSLSLNETKEKSTSKLNSKRIKAKADRQRPKTKMEEGLWSEEKAMWKKNQRQGKKRRKKEARLNRT